MARWNGEYSFWRPYVPIARRRAEAAKTLRKLEKNGHQSRPVIIEGRTIAHTFWGKAWCENLERYSDFSNRLPRGRTYVRNGSVIDLQIAAGEVKALVSGSSLYKVSIELKPAAKKRWGVLKEACAGQIDSLVELLQGRLSSGVMARITAREGGLFPEPSEIAMKCSCPDWATMCKHVAAVLYGVGARLDEEPELLFTLRQVQHLELISAAATSSLAAPGSQGDGAAPLAEDEMEALFGIEIAEGGAGPAPSRGGRALGPPAPSIGSSPGISRGTAPERAPERSLPGTPKARLLDPRAARPAAARRAGVSSPGSSAGSRRPSRRQSAASVPEPAPAFSRKEAAVLRKVRRELPERLRHLVPDPGQAPAPRPSASLPRGGYHAKVDLAEARAALLRRHFDLEAELRPAVYRSLTGALPAQASRELRRLCDAGLLIQKGSKRGTRYERGARLA